MKVRISRDFSRAFCMIFFSDSSKIFSRNSFRYSSYVLRILSLYFFGFFSFLQIVSKIYQWISPQIFSRNSYRKNLCLFSKNYLEIFTFVYPNISQGILLIICWEIILGFLPGFSHGVSSGIPLWIPSENPLGFLHECDLSSDRNCIA